MAAMISADDNERLTRTGPGTPMGAVMRHYWQPLVLIEELPAERPAKDVRVLGEDIVVFRDAAGRYGALARRCAHRGGDLAYGRLEDGGLRCPYHGWLYDIAGRCLEQPAEPAGSRYHERIRQPAYPCIERNGIVYGYMGPGEAPPLPGFDWHEAPPDHTFVFKGLQRANWLQALEGEIDPSHLSYLHRYLSDRIDDDASYGFKQFLVLRLQAVSRDGRGDRGLGHHDPARDTEPAARGRAYRFRRAHLCAARLGRIHLHAGDQFRVSPHRAGPHRRLVAGPDARADR